MSSADNYNKNVFINCPFDDDYDPIFNAILFAVHRCGFILRCSKEFEDSTGIRIKNIISLIAASKYSIHDLSRVTTSGELPRFNMPLELGICIGAIEFGAKKHKEKEYLILESEQFRFKQFISDISGQDIKAHNEEPFQAIKCVRNWLSRRGEETIPSASLIIEEYTDFLVALPELCEENKWVPDELTFHEYSSLVTTWLAFE
jgi:hypothetical protein